MKINFSVTYLIAFLAMLFLIQELHDWAHVSVAEWICGCWGTKTFDSWTTCEHCEASGNILVLAWLAGPALSFLLIWIAWSLMSRRHSSGTRSFGFSLLFAANPFANILAASAGGGDITMSMRTLYQHPDGSNRHFISIAALVIVLVLTAPPFMKAVSMIKGQKEKLMLIPAFLILPNFIKILVVSKGMNWLLSEGIFQEEVFTGVPLLVVMWLFLLIILLLVNFRSIMNFLKKKERKNSLRI